MSSLKNVDLKCSETLRDSPSPPPQQPHQHLHPSPNTSVFASTVISPSHHGQQQPTVSLLVRKSESQRPTSPVGHGSSGESVNTASAEKKIGSSPPFNIASVISLPKPSLSSHYSTQAQQSAMAQQSHVFPGIPRAPIWSQSMIQQHPHAGVQIKPGVWTPVSSSTGSSPSKIIGATSATLPLALSPSKASDGSSSSSQSRPLTLHVSTSRGPAVLQLQQSSASSGTTGAVGKQSIKLLPAAGLSSPSSHQPPQSTSAVGVQSPVRSSVASLSAATSNTAPIRVPVLRPSPVHPMAAATAAAALLSQLAPNAPAFGLADPHNQHLHQQQLVAAAALLRTPLANAGTVIPNVLGVPQNVSQANTSSPSSRSVIIPGSHIAATSGSLPIGASGAANVISTITKASAALTPTTSFSTAVTQSPTRPSILRKRVADSGNGASPNSKRLAYEPVTLAKRANEKGTLTPDSDSRPGTSMTSTVSSTIIENPEAGNSNQSSSASTISAGSTIDNGNGHSANSSQATITGIGSPSPRKRPRKQQLSELTSTPGYGSDDDASTPVVSYHCESIEEETVVGPTGIDGRYHSSESPSRSHRQGGQASLFLPTVAGDLYDQCQTPQKKNMKSEYSLSSSMSQRLFERPSTSFDQLQQQIEEQRKHMPLYRPRPSLLAQYELSYDSKRYHFAVYDDVRRRDEKRPSMIELSNQKQIWQRIGGWKTHLMGVQFDNVDREEKTNLDDLNELHELLNSTATDCRSDDGDADDSQDSEERREMKIVTEMVLTNVQRVRVIREQLDDGKKQLMSLLKHKSSVEKLIHKFTSKRPIRKKDRGRGRGILD